MEFSATTTISADPATVWAILTDAERFPTWEPNVTRVEGRIAPGERITVHTTLSARAFPVTVSEFVPRERMVWSSAMPLGLFRGARTFTLEPLGGGTTRVTTREVFGGWLLPILGRTIPDLQPTFEQFAAALKAEAERDAG
ncbi:SRPBCC family protein [Rubrivirga sp. IMCC45206]|uniref:SRPBCC family protein n=1 Tax=Rubrivirga sp. IMCC45206 TaxID=3391614 RepID=UPI00398FDACF